METQAEHVLRGIEEIIPQSSWQLRYHQRAVTDLVFNMDGDLLFSACKDKWPVVWRCNTGEKVGAYKGHTGAIFSIDVNRDSTLIASGSGDGHSMVWDVETGKRLHNFDNAVSTKSVNFSPDGRELVLTTDAIMGHPPFVWIYDVASGDVVKKHRAHSAPTKAHFTGDGGHIIYGDTQGRVAKIDSRALEVVKQNKVHNGKISSLKPSFCRTYCVTGSEDFKSKIIDYEDLSVVREFVSDSPVNSACVSPDNRMVMCGGGTNARDVTTTGGKGNFNVEVFDCVTSSLVGSYTIHFGTVNAVSIHPSGMAYASGAEDGVLNLVRLTDDSFQSAPFSWHRGPAAN